MARGKGGRGQTDGRAAGLPVTAAYPSSASTER